MAQKRDEWKGKTIDNIIKANSWFFENIDKIDKLVARLIKKKKKTQITKICDKRRDITTDLSEIKRIIREYYEQLYTNRLYNRWNVGVPIVAQWIKDMT